MSISPSRARRRAHGDVEHPRGTRRHDAHRHRARIRRPTARHVHRCRGHRDLAQRDPLTLRELERALLVHARVGDHRDVGDRHLQPRHEIERQAFDRLVELLLRDQQRALAELG